MTAQEIFNTVWAAMIAQGRPSKRNAVCLYRGPEGTKCAVGCLLTDEEAEGLDDSTDGVSVWTIYERGRLPERLIPHLKLLGDLQRAHDDPFDRDEPWIEVFKKRATHIAERFDLTVPK